MKRFSLILVVLLFSLVSFSCAQAQVDTYEGVVSTVCLLDSYGKTTIVYFNDGTSVRFHGISDLEAGYKYRLTIETSSAGSKHLRGVVKIDENRND